MSRSGPRAAAAVGCARAMETTTIRVREPRELLALLPYQLGFHPQESCVAVSLRAPRGRVGLVARMDLRDLGDLEHGPQTARALVSHLVSDGARRAVLVLYTDSDPRYAAENFSGDGKNASGPSSGLASSREPRAGVQAALIRAAAEQFRDAAEPFLGDVPVWLVARTGYLALDCTDDECCPPGGRPLRELESTQVGAHMVLAGAMAQDSRESLVQIRPAAAASRRNAARVANRARARRARAESDGGERLARWRADGLAAWRAALAVSLAGACAPAGSGAGARAGAGPGASSGSGSVTPAVLGRIDAALGDVQVRDAVLLTMVPGTGDLPERAIVAPDSGPTWSAIGATTALGTIFDSGQGVPPDDALAIAAADVLERVVAHTVGVAQAPALTLLGLLAWWRADGARAAVLIDRALEADPTHRLALLIGEAVAGGLPPGWVRRAT